MIRGHVIQDASIIPEPREHLLRDRSVHSLEAALDADVVLGGALAASVVFLPVPFIDAIIFDAAQLRLSACGRLERTIAVVNQTINIWIVRQTCLQNLLLDVVSLRPSLRNYSNDPAVFRTHNHKPTVVEHQIVATCARPARLSRPTGAIWAGTWTPAKLQTGGSACARRARSEEGKINTCGIVGVCSCLPKDRPWR